MSRILHVIPRLTLGGASRSLFTVVSSLAARPGAAEHTIVSLRRGDAEMVEAAAAAGVDVLHEPSVERLDREIAGADVVQIDWWNSPELAELLRRPLPSARLAVWSHVGGTSAPQVLPGELVGFADAFVASTPLTGQPRVIPDIADPSRVTGIERIPHEDYAVGYVGTVDPAKMHPAFADLCAGVDAEDARFVVCGTGDGFAAIAARAEELGARDRFDLRGYVSDVGTVLAELDVFGYPLCPGNYGAGELVLQEAMHAGLPAVVLPHGGAATLVVDGETGIVAADERAYVRALEGLGRDEELRLRLGDAARRYAQREFSPAAVAGAWAAIYAELMERPKRTRAALSPVSSGAELFLTGLGDEGEPFRRSLAATAPAEGLAADEEVAAVPAVIVTSDGGLIDFRRRFPEDLHLRLWTGLALRTQGRNALAAGELAAALRLGCDPRRAAPGLAAAGDALGHPEVASRAREAALAVGGAR